MQTNYTISEENYLKSIYHLQQSASKVTTNELSRHLNTKPASVTEMMKKLQSKKLLVYTPYKGFRLSKVGCAVAVGIIRRHRLWEYFLAEKLHFGWDEVHEMAEQLEHVSNDKLTDKLDAFLNHPRFDPHGDPIPDKNGKMALQKRIRLQEMQIGSSAEICAVAGQHSSLLEIMKTKNLAIGTQVEIRKKFDFDNSIELKINGTKPVFISDKIAAVIFCKAIKIKGSKIV